MSSVALYNHTDYLLHLKELQENAPEGCYSHEITVANGTRKVLRANKFIKRNVDSGRCSQIVLFLGTSEYETTLIPQNFPPYSELHFYLVSGDFLQVFGVPANQSQHPGGDVWMGMKPKGSVKLFATGIRGLPGAHTGAALPNPAPSKKNRT